MRLKLIALIFTFLIVTTPFTYAINSLGLIADEDIQEVPSVYSGNLITGQAIGDENTVIVGSDGSVDVREGFFREDFANIVVTVESYEPTVLTSAVLEEGRRVPVFVNLKGYSADPSLDQIRVLSVSPRITEVRTKPGRNIPRPSIQAFFNRDTTLDNLGYLVVWINRLEQEHAPVEETTLFADLPKEKQDEILADVELTNKTEEERRNILDEQARSLVSREKNQDWVLDLPKKSPFLEEIEMDLQLDIQFETLQGFGSFEESKVAKQGERIAFWNGQGSIQVKEVGESHVVVDLFSGDARLLRKDLKLGV